MDPASIAAIIQWIGLGEQLVGKGKAVYDRVKAAMAAEGIEADTAALDAVIVDADARRAAREREAAGGE